MSTYTKVAHRANALAEDTSQVSQRAIVHLQDESHAILCGSVKPEDAVAVDQKRVVSCMTCRDALTKITADQVHQSADRDLIAALRMRSMLAPHPASYLAGLLRTTANQLERRLQRIESGNALHHDTSVPQAGDDALTPNKDGFNCALCEDTGRRFGKRCECIGNFIDGIPHFTPYD